MSATIDGARIAKALGDAPVIASEGRAFPVETRYVGRDPLPGTRLDDHDAQAVRDDLITRVPLGHARTDRQNFAGGFVAGFLCGVVLARPAVAGTRRLPGSGSAR